MIVSWNWLKDYVDLDMTPDELAHRLAMSGLNHEGTEQVEDDLAIDLEVTSNRPDCLGHIGVAREVAALWDSQLKLPQPALKEIRPSVEQLTRVTIDCPDLCQRYIARIIRGVKIGPSPDWLQRRLRTLGIGVINNVVDISNYVLMECGQPLHAFDLAKLAGPEIIVRRARGGEAFLAIDHRTYLLDGEMCVIADTQKAVALGGVMGGEQTEVSQDTQDLLIESAQFHPLSIRSTARKLNLHSPSSYRFERGVDPEGVDWASRRCCQMILELAGGELAEGACNVGDDMEPRRPIVLRLSQLPRVLGIEIAADEVRRILTALGNQERAADSQQIQVLPPSWRRDLTREIDLVEEVARIHGYDEIPEDVGVPMAPSHRRDEDRLLDKVRDALTAAGFDEAMTGSVVRADDDEAFSPWTDQAALQSDTPMLKGADRLRRSLIPSLLQARRLNESLHNTEIELFETAHIYLPQAAQLPVEQWTLALTSGRDYYVVKGILESMLDGLHVEQSLDAVSSPLPLLDSRRSAALRLGDRTLGFLGELAPEARDQFQLRQPACIAELSLELLRTAAQFVPQHTPISPFPTIERDINLVVQETLRWSDLQRTVRSVAGPELESLAYRETYRDTQKDGPGKKRLLFSMTLRAGDRTMTNEEADAIRQRIVSACHELHQARLLE